MDSFPYENWLHNLFNGVGIEDLTLASPENWLRAALMDYQPGQDPEIAIVSEDTEAPL